MSKFISEEDAFRVRVLIDYMNSLIELKSKTNALYDGMTIFKKIDKVSDEIEKILLG